MAIDFPNSPSTNDQYTVGTTTWVYNGTAWVVALGDASIATAAITADKIASGAAVANIGYTPANIAGPTFTGTVTLPSTTSIGTVSATEIGYVDGVTSAIQTQLDSKLTATTAVTSNRNKIINGAMSVWQRGTSFSAASSYTADRFYVDTGTVTRQTGTEQFAYCLRIANSTNNPAVRHAIELPAAGVAGLFTVGSTWTVSFYARTSTTVTSNLSFYAAFCDSNVVNNNQIVLDTALPVPTTSWARYSKTFTIGVSPLGANLAMTIVPFLNSGAYAGNFEITGIQLEAGSVATPFEFEDIGTTLAKCQRYFNRAIDFSADNGGTATQHAVMVGQNFASTGGYGAFIYPRMRTSPVVTFSGGSHFIAAGAGGNNITTTAMQANAIKPTSCELRYTVASGLGTGDASFIYTSSSTGKIDLSAEL
jgi:hypothetical protein